MATFGPVGSSTVTSSATGATNPVVQNVVMTTAGTEYSCTVVTSTTRFELRSRQLGVLKLSYVSGASGTTFKTIPAGCAYVEANLLLGSPTTIYIQSSKNGDTLEIVSWS